MKKLILCFTFFLVIFLTLPLPATAQVVDIPDPNLHAAIEAALGKASGTPITADEMITLTDFSGWVARTLDVGHRIASAYENRSKAIYWDGRNDVGERVASGVCFYTLSAGEYSATCRMLIIK